MMRAERPRAGFTLLELLLVIAILGIIFGIFSWFLLRNLRQTELREAAAQLIADLRRSRSNAQQSGRVSTLELSPLKTAYSLKVGSGAPRTVGLPHRVTVEAQVGGSRVVNQPPFGTLDDTGLVWKLQSPSYSDMRLYVKVIGITGRVMLSAAAD